MLPIALLIGRICGKIAESRGADRKAWFWRGTIISFLLIWGWHQKREYQKIKSMDISIEDIIKARFHGRKE